MPYMFAGLCLAHPDCESLLSSSCLIRKSSERRLKKPKQQFWGFALDLGQKVVEKFDLENGTSQVCLEQMHTNAVITLYIPVMNRNIYITISSEILQYANQFCLINTWDPHFLHDNGCPFLLIAFSSQLEPWATLLTKLGLARLIDLGDPESYSWLWDIDDIVSSRSPHFFKQCANPPRELRVRRLNNHIRVSVAKPTNQTLIAEHPLPST